MTIKEAVDKGIEELKKNKVSEPESSVTFLLASVLDKDRAYIYAHGEKSLTKAQEKKIRGYLNRRKKHEPVWYILGEVEFYGRKFYINNDVLTPRPETEFLIQEVLKVAEREGQGDIIEIGTGSGAISVTLAKESNKKITATDISKKALKVAKKNAKNIGVLENVKFVQGDLLEPIVNGLLPNAIIVANLPYIPHEDMETLQFDVLHHEPREALDGGREGLEIYERLISQMKDRNFTGRAFFEIGIGQGEKLRKIVKGCFPKAEVKIKKDLADIDRIAIISI